MHTCLRVLECGFAMHLYGNYMGGGGERSNLQDGYQLFLVDTDSTNVTTVKIKYLKMF